jgi:hypothetical protein
MECERIYLPSTVMFLVIQAHLLELFDGTQFQILGVGDSSNAFIGILCDQMLCRMSLVRTRLILGGLR